MLKLICFIGLFLQVLQEFYIAKQQCLMPSEVKQMDHKRDECSKQPPKHGRMKKAHRILIKSAKVMKCQQKRLMVTIEYQKKPPQNEVAFPKSLEAGLDYTLVHHSIGNF